MVQRPIDFNAFEFVVLAGLRAAQLARGCTPRVAGFDKVTVTAQAEVAEGNVVREARIPLRGSGMMVYEWRRALTSANRAADRRRRRSRCCAASSALPR